MSGDPTNANQWVDADVYVGTTTAVNPATVGTPFDATWDLVGLLDGDAGFVESRNEDTSDTYAWGGILVKTSRRNFKLTKTFTALEYSETTRDLIWPGSATGEIKVPRPVRKKIAFETTEGTKIRRLISQNEVEIVINGDITENESDVSKYEFMVTIFPDADGVLFVEQTDDLLGS